MKQGRRLAVFALSVWLLGGCGGSTSGTPAAAPLVSCSNPKVVDPPVTMEVDSIATYDACGATTSTVYTGTISINADGGGGWKRFTSTDAVGEVWSGWIKSKSK